MKNLGGILNWVKLKPSDKENKWSRCGNELVNFGMTVGECKLEINNNVITAMTRLWKIKWGEVWEKCQQ